MKKYSEKSVVSTPRGENVCLCYVLKKKRAAPRLNARSRLERSTSPRQ